MRIDHLRLIAWGAFRNAALDLTAGSEGVHAIVGPNEAGKSCALRAVRALLFGMPHICPDAFVHDQRSLAVGARLRRANGDSLSFVRKKARSNSLIDEHGDVLSDAALLPFLGGMDAGLFESLFGIDHQALRSGAEALLAENGHVGQAIVAASAGYRNLGGVIREIEGQAERLFKSGRGKAPVINAALAEMKAESDRMAEATVRFSKYQDAMKAMEAAEEEQRKISAQLQQLRAMAARLERHRKALPLIAEEGALRLELADLGAVVALPEGFAVERQRVEGDLRNARVAAESARTALEGIESDLRDLLVPEQLLEQAEAIATLPERLGAHNKGVTDAPGLRARLDEAERDVYYLLRDLGRPASLDEVDTLRIPAPTRSGIQELGGKLPLFEQQLQQHRDRQVDLVENIRKTNDERAALGPVIDPSDLRSVVEAVQAEGDLDRLLAKTIAELQKDEAQVAADFGKLGLVRGSLDRLDGLPVPLDATVDRFQNDWTSVEHELRTGKDRLKELQKETTSTEAELAALRLSGETPTEQELLYSRRTRDDDWKALRTAWSAGEPADLGACDEYGQKVRMADEVADRLRREADRVTTQAGLLARRSRQEKEVAGLMTHLAALEDQRQALAAGWTAAWEPASIDPLSPLEMRSWTCKYTALVSRVSQTRDRRAEVKNLAESIERNRRSLLAAIEAYGQRADFSGEGLGAAVRSAKAILARLDSIEAKRQTLTRTLGELEAARAKADGQAKSVEVELARWKESWTQMVAAARMPEHTTPVEAIAILSRTQDIIEKANSANSLRHRLRGIDVEAAEFTHDVAALVGRVAPDLVAAGPAQAAATLHTRLQKARENAARQEELEKARAERTRDGKTAVTTIDRCERHLAELCSIAGCATSDDLAKAEQRSNRSRKLEQRVRELRLQLATLAGASEVDSFVAEASKDDPDALTARIAETERQIEKLDTLRKAQEETIGGLKVRREQMQGGSNAAAGAENVESVRAKVRDSVERYLHARIATAILRREVELYRKAHQGPIVKRASELFSTLTVGSFGGIDIEYGDDGTPSIVGTRPGGERLSINQLSDGTRDQLFLSLRLASIEGYLDRNEPVPFIVDDIFVHFDDRRAAAALAVLGELSKRTQVIVFTHHQHLVEVAKGTGCANALVVHTI